MPSVAAQYPYLTAEQAVGTYIFGNPAVHLRNAYVLLGRRYRGEDQIVPDEEGETPYREILAAGEHQLELLLIGAWNSDGTRPTISPQANLYLLMDEVAEATGPLGADGTRATTLHFPDGSTTRSANCHFSNVEYAKADGPTVVATLRIKVPAGKFAAA